MKKNINKSGRIVRVVIGITSIALSFTDFFEDYVVDYGFLTIGVVFTIASVVEVCPLFYFLGINTNKKKKLRMY